MNQAIEALLSGVGTVGKVLDYPGRLVRGALSGRLGEDVSGRDLLEHYGLLDANQEGLDAGDVAGFGAEMLLDPMNLVGPGILKKMFGVAGKSTAVKSARASAAKDLVKAPADVPALSYELKRGKGRPLGGYNSDPAHRTFYDLPENYKLDRDLGHADFDPADTWKGSSQAGTGDIRAARGFHDQFDPFEYWRGSGGMTEQPLFPNGGLIKSNIPHRIQPRVLPSLRGGGSAEELAIAIKRHRASLAKAYSAQAIEQALARSRGDDE